MGVSYDVRLNNFGSWPHAYPSASQVALAGFVSIHRKAARCIGCNLQFSPWKKRDEHFVDHASLRPDCPFSYVHTPPPKEAISQPAANNSLNAAPTQAPEAPSQHLEQQLSCSPTESIYSAKSHSEMKLMIEENTVLKAKVQKLEEQKTRAEAEVAAGKALEFWKIEAETAKAAVADTLADKGALEATLVTEMHELKAESKALVTTIAPLQAAIEALTATVARLQSDGVTTNHVYWDSAYDHHDQSSNASGVDVGYGDGWEDSPAAYSNDGWGTKLNTIHNGGGNNDADLAESKVDVGHWDSWGNPRAGYSNDGWGSTSDTTRNEDGNADARAADDTVSDNGSASGDSWSILKPSPVLSDGSDDYGGE